MIPALESLGPALVSAAAGAVAWQLADLRRLSTQAEAAWQDLAVARSRGGASPAIEALERYYTDVTRRYHRRLRQVPARWLARAMGCAPRPQVLNAEPAPRPPGAWG